MNRQLNSYVKSILPEPYVILGLKLRPFCLGHLFLMQRFDCGYASENPEYMGGFTDLLLGLAICCRTYEEFLEFIEDKKEFNRWCKEWGNKINKFLKKNKDYNMLEPFRDFSRYIKDGITVPKYWEGEKPEKVNESGAHWSQNILITLISELNYSRTAALNSPLSQTLAECFKLAENKGTLTLMSDYELETIEKQEANISFVVPKKEVVTNG